MIVLEEDQLSPYTVSNESRVFTQTYAAGLKVRSRPELSGPRHLCQMTNKHRILGVCLGIGGLIQVAKTSAADYYVNGGGGNDANPGSSVSPWKTIQHAANAVNPGDTVNIAGGTYAETVTISRSGLATNPITFQASSIRTVRLTHPTNVRLFQTGYNGTYTGKFITLRGLVFSDAPLGEGAVFAAQGWRIEDCTFERNSGLVARDPLDSADDVTVLRTVFQDCLENSIVAYGPSSSPPSQYNFTIKDCIVRRSNRRNTDPGYSTGAFKLLWQNGLLVDGLISYDNQGPGAWLDFGSINVVVRNCTFFGNHAGYTSPSTDQSWNAAGLEIEANPGPILIENNVFYSNLADGLHQAQSGRDAQVSIQNCKFVGNQRNQIFFNAFSGGDPMRVLSNTTIANNLFKSWGTANFDTVAISQIPSALNIIINSNRYDAEGASATWARWSGASYTGLPAMQGGLGIEAAGSEISTGPFKGQLPAGSIYVYPTASSGDYTNPAPAKIKQVDADEVSSITSVVAGKSPGDTVTFPVFGHTPISGSGPFYCQVYDLQGRYATLSLADAAARSSFEAAVTPYAIRYRTMLIVRLTRNDPYQIEAAYVRPISTSPVQLDYSLLGSQIHFIWPEDHIGWQLQAQTTFVGGGEWTVVPGLELTNRFLLPLDATPGSLFLRLAYP